MGVTQRDNIREEDKLLSPVSRESKPLILRVSVECFKANVS